MKIGNVNLASLLADVLKDDLVLVGRTSYELLLSFLVVPFSVTCEVKNFRKNL